jgi:hypothetical protein
MLHVDDGSRARTKVQAAVAFSYPLNSQSSFRSALNIYMSV